MELNNFDSLLQLIVLINFAFAASTKKYNKLITEEILIPVNWIKKRYEKSKDKIKLLNHSTQIIIYELIRRNLVKSKSKQIKVIDRLFNNFNKTLDNTNQYYNNILDSKTLTSALSSTCLFSGLYAFLLLFLSLIPSIESNLDFLDSYLAFNCLFIIYIIAVILKDCCGFLKSLSFKKYSIIVTFIVFLLIVIWIYFSNRISLISQYLNNANIPENGVNNSILNIYKILIFSSIILSFSHFIIYFFRMFFIHLGYSIKAIISLKILDKKISSFEKNEYKKLNDILDFLEE